MEYYKTPSWVQIAKTASSGSMRVLKKELEERYTQFAILPVKLFWEIPDSLGYINVPTKTLVGMENKLQKELSKKKLLDECVSRNNQGIALEKRGDVDAAISIYEENIKPGCYPAMHSFDRLLILYRKNKDFKNELRVCKRAIIVFKKMDKYSERLKKIEELISKTLK